MGPRPPQLAGRGVQDGSWLHPLESLAYIVVAECELSGALEPQQDWPIFHADPMRPAVTVGVRVVNGGLTTFP
jgi:hypothetical protein